MGADAVIDRSSEEKARTTPPVPQSLWGKLLYGSFIIVMPIFSFWATDLFKPEWQTGQFSDYLILLLFPEASWLFFILMAYSIVCYWLLLIDTGQYSQKFLVRFGIYSGVLLALQYSILSGLYLINNSNDFWSFLFLIVLWGSPFLLPKVYHWSINRWKAERVNLLTGILALALLVVGAVVMRGPLFPFTLILVGLTAAAPFWCFLMALRAGNWLFRTYEFRFTFAQGLGLATWIAGYSAAWRFDILKMYELYAALPPQPPPDCYIATAAAQGHPKFVGSWRVRRANGESMRVNQQLQILKCAELALMAVQPRTHRVLRRVYDVLGRFLAKRIQDPFLADAAYLLLKPWDRLARWGLRIIIPEIDSIASQVYGN